MATTVWKGQLSFGLVSVPVRLFRAARKERMPLQYLRPEETRVETRKTAWSPEGQPSGENGDEDDTHTVGADPPSEAPTHVSPVRQSFTPSSGGLSVPREELLLGYKVAPEHYVVVDKEEIRRLRLPTSPVMEILRTVHLDEIDPVYFETSYYVVPDKGGDRAYALLFQALQQTKYVAVAHVAMHGREHILIVRPGQKGLLAHTMYYTDEVRADTEFETKTGDVTKKEVDLATKFVEAIAAPFAPEEFKDRYREDLQKIIAAKQKHHERAFEGATKAAAPGKIVDIMEALRESLSRAERTAEENAVQRKPAAVVSTTKRRQKRKA